MSIALEISSTVRDLIDRMALSQPDMPYLICPESKRTLTFKELQYHAVKSCFGFQQNGLKQGDKIAFLMDNSLSAAILFLSAMYGGFVGVPLNARGGASQLSYMLEHSGVKIVIVEEKYRGLLSETMKEVRGEIKTVSFDTYELWRERAEQTLNDRPPILRNDDPVLLMYSSGTTGQPKGAVHTHRSILAHGRNSILAHKLTSSDRSLLVLPLYHINAECVTLIPTLMSGGSVVVPRGFLVSEFWNWLDDYRCTWSAVVPTIIGQLLDWKDPKAENRAACFERIRFLRSSSAPLSPALHREFLEKFKLPLIQAMGSSEAGNVFSNPVPPGTNKIGSPGLAWGFETKIVGRQGEELPAGEPGEVLIRGDGMMQGYYKDPAETPAALDADAWLHTGDLAYQDEEGYFFVVGRSKELIIKGGMNIAPKQIDEILESHSAVLEAAAVGVPDRYVGEDIVAFAILRDGVKCDESDLLSFCESRLGHFKTPSRIHFVRDLPKGPSGKVQRLKLQEELAEQSFLPVSAAQDLTRSSDKASGASTPIEQIIRETWAKLLKQPNVDPQSNFFALGGHSLLAMQCLALLRDKLPLRISMADFFENVTVAQQAALIRSRLRPDNVSAADPTVSWEQELLLKVGSPSVDETIPPRDRSLPCPLSPNQRRIWFMEQVIAGAPVYNEAEAVRLRGELDVGALEEALNVIVARHENFRSTVQTTDDEPTVIVHESWPLRLKQIDLSSLTPPQRAAEIERLLIDEPRLPYDLKTEPGIRATLLHLGEKEHIFILMMHHLICDWSSEGVLWRELSALYSAARRSQPFVLPPLPIHHGDYAIWQQRQLDSDQLAEDLGYWERQLRAAPTLLDLPMDKPSRPPTISYRGTRKRFQIPPKLTFALRDCAKRERVSLFTVVAAALNTLLYRYTGHEDVLVGIPLADRDRPELQTMIGFLLHTHVLRTLLAEDLSFRQLLAQVQKSVLDLYAHRSPPFDHVVNKVRPERNPSYSPLFQVMLNWRDRDQQLTFIGLDGLEVELVLAESRTSKFDLTLMFTDAGDNIDLEIEYNTDLFDEARIERMAGHLGTLLEAGAANPGRPLSDLPLLTEAERRQLLVDWNQTEASYPKDVCLHELFEEQVELTPNATAVEFEGERLTYRELNERANQLARHLQGLGVGPDALVAICLERSLEMVVGLLAILKAGGAYVPLDPSYPTERLAFMLSDAQARVLVTRQSLAGILPTGAAQVVYVDTQWAFITQHGAENLETPVRPHQLAYVIYTSGSTGRPKGVCGEHRGTLNRLRWMWRQYPFAAGERCCQKTVLSFVDSVSEIFGPLLQGVAAVLIAEPLVRDPSRLVTALAEAKVTRIVLVPSLLRVLLDQYADLAARLPSLSHWTSSGEALAGDLAERFLEQLPGRILVNLYGSSEVAADATWFEVPPNVRSGPTPIGRPIDNIRAYILDTQQRPVPVGVRGELHIGGLGVARGYHHRPELTAERFIPDPFRSVPEARLYKTGDLARYLPNGAIEYLGRLDYQVKIRGLRIELGEIESVLSALPGVGEAVVLVRQDVPGNEQLVAYLKVSKDEPPRDSELRILLRAKLPEYMIPSALVVLDHFPLTPNGKVDRKALPRPDLQSLNPAEFAPPRTKMETALADIWRRALGLGRVGRHDNFFELGGHSLLAVRVIAEIDRTLNVHVNVPQFFQNPTIEQLARSVEPGHRFPLKPRVLMLQQGHVQPALYFVGAGPSEIRMAKFLTKDRAVYGTEAPLPIAWRRALASARPTISQLGKLYGNAVRAHAGTSPCVLAGYSFHGKVVIEAARALQQAGGQIAMVLLIELNVWSGPADRIKQTLLRNLRSVRSRNEIGTADEIETTIPFSASLGRSLRSIGWLVAQAPPLVKRNLAVLIPREDEVQEAPGWVDEEGAQVTLDEMAQLFLRSGSSFDPSPLDATAVLFRTRQPGDKLLPGGGLDSGWEGRFTRGLEIIEVSGDHLSLIREERNVAALARKITGVLRRVTVASEVALCH